MNYTPSWLNNVHVFVGCFCYREGSISFTSFTQWTSLFSVKTGPLSPLNLNLMELLIVYFSEQSIKYQMRIKRTFPLCNSYDDISKISILIFYLWLNFPSLMIFQIIPAVLLIHTLRHYGTGLSLYCWVLNVVK